MIHFLFNDLIIKLCPALVSTVVSMESPYYFTQQSSVIFKSKCMTVFPERKSFKQFRLIQETGVHECPHRGIPNSIQLLFSHAAIHTALFNNMESMLNLSLHIHDLAESYADGDILPE